MQLNRLPLLEVNQRKRFSCGEMKLRKGGAEKTVKKQTTWMEHTVLFDFKAEQEHELDLREGEVILIAKEEAKMGWLRGCMAGKLGYMPSSSSS